MFQLGNRLWHTDSSFRHVPAKASLLYARSIAPIGGHTQFADLRAAFDALAPARQARLAQLVAEHSIFTSRAKLGFSNFAAEERASMPPVLQLLVRTIPESGRRSLYLASRAGRDMQRATVADVANTCGQEPVGDRLLADEGQRFAGNEFADALGRVEAIAAKDVEHVVDGAGLASDQ